MTDINKLIADIESLPDDRKLSYANALGTPQGFIHIADLKHLANEYKRRGEALERISKTSCGGSNPPTRQRRGTQHAREVMDRRRKDEPRRYLQALSALDAGSRRIR